ncbi:nuclear transport factor 2 family protein [Dactylosporangium sp. AC04546]|uniref:nuclear transport factor 2 family protein n=1 Tax=Dactylosporangium sp. AC04546 TaxID=2862460 RepID=UPI001EE0A04A|nr:nuclear transport factor 2 family protein [Dactylosporangium sp. AC04546]WVK84986.1 nuclear transport factor 2 family protein [Dactylosporangium sp. AC04546]
MTDYEKLAERYIQIWNDTNPTTRRAAIDELFTEDATFVDPMAAVAGPAAIDGVIGAVQAQLPGYVLRLAGAVDGHHDQARFGWEGAQPGGAAEVAGFDVVTLAPDGRINRVLGFLDLVPA